MTTRSTRGSSYWLTTRRCACGHTGGFHDKGCEGKCMAYTEQKPGDGKRCECSGFTEATK